MLIGWALIGSAPDAETEGEALAGVGPASGAGSTGVPASPSSAGGAETGASNQLDGEIGIAEMGAADTGTAGESASELARGLPATSSGVGSGYRGSSGMRIGADASAGRADTGPADTGPAGRS